MLKAMSKIDLEHKTAFKNSLTSWGEAALRLIRREINRKEHKETPSFFFVLFALFAVNSASFFSALHYQKI